jgi:hypothetical protein
VASEPPDNKIDNKSRSRIEEMYAMQSAGLRRLMRWTSIILGVLVIIQFGLGIWSIALTKEQGDTNDKVVIQSRAIAAQTLAIKRQTSEIQEERRQTALDSCLDRNKRHDKSIETLHELAADIGKKHPELRIRLKETVKQNIILIGALQPKQDCQKVANAVTKTG